MANQHKLSSKGHPVAGIIDRLEANPVGWQDANKPPYGVDMIREYTNLAARTLKESDAECAELVGNRNRTVIRVATLAAIGVASMALLAGSSTIESPADPIAPAPATHVNIDIAPGLQPPNLEQFPQSMAF